MLNSPPLAPSCGSRRPCLMPLPTPAADRQLKHRRNVDVQVFARGDGLWEVDAVLVDTKTRVTNMADGPRPAGTPIHEMLLRLVVDRQLNVLEAGSDTRWMPYPGTCGNHGDAYSAMVGLNLLQGVIRASVEDAKDLTDEEFATFPMDELSKLSNEIMKFSGIGAAEGK